MGIDKTTGYNYLYKPNHPNSKQNGMIAEHTYIISEKLGRPLNKGEQCHHIDGNKLNNNENNLQLMTLLDHVHMHMGKRPIIECLICASKTKNYKYCSSKCCHLAQRRVERPPKEELIFLVKKYNYSKVGRMFGVTDNTIRKWLK